jgi:hypothetical protein
MLKFTQCAHIKGKVRTDVQWLNAYRMYEYMVLIVITCAEPAVNILRKTTHKNKR